MTRRRPGVDESTDLFVRAVRTPGGLLSLCGRRLRNASRPARALQWSRSLVRRAIRPNPAVRRGAQPRRTWPPVRGPNDLARRAVVFRSLRSSHRRGGCQLTAAPTDARVNSHPNQLVLTASCIRICGRRRVGHGLPKFFGWLGSHCNCPINNWPV